MARAVADQMVQILAAAGLRRIYGTVGDGLNGFADTLRRHGGIRWLHMRHKKAAAFTAGAGARVAGPLAVCAGFCGLGNLHLINGLFDCHRPWLPPRLTPLRLRTAQGPSRNPSRSGCTAHP